jgi:hypothetical protein
MTTATITYPAIDPRETDPLPAAKLAEIARLTPEFRPFVAVEVAQAILNARTMSQLAGHDEPPRG